MRVCVFFGYDASRLRLLSQHLVKPRAMTAGEVGDYGSEGNLGGAETWLRLHARQYLERQSVSPAQSRARVWDLGLGFKV
jgi:hypothetical protein